jgi:hypothetical protein
MIISFGFNIQYFARLYDKKTSGSIQKHNKHNYESKIK